MAQRWETFTAWLIQHTDRWPKTRRFTLTQRLQNHALDLMEELVVARYEPARRRDLLSRVNLRLERMRFLIRIAHATGVTSTRTLGTFARGLDEAGRMVHGWRQAEERRGHTT